MMPSIPRPPTLTIQLSTSFALGTLSGALTILTLLALRRRILTEDLKRSIPPISPTHHADALTDYGGAVRYDTKDTTTADREATRTAEIAARARKGEYDEELILEQLSRNRLFLRDEGLRKVRDAFVVVVGLGGVGSHAVAALARSGVGRIRVVDFDQVTLSSLNRHALATLADVGGSKVGCVRRRLEGVAPWVRVDARGELLGRDSVGRLLGVWDYEVGREEGVKQVDWVVDAIDNIDTKVDLLKYCHDHGIKVVSAMGAGCKSDPTRVMVGDIGESFEDPLSQATRRRLRLAGVKDGIPVVFSTEKPGEGKAQLQPIAENEVEKGNVSSLGVLPDFRIRILPVLGTMPAVFGYTAANHVLLSLANYPTEYRVSERGRAKMYEGIYSALQGLIQKLVKYEGGESFGLRLPMSIDDVGYLVEEVWGGRSAVSGLTTRLALIPWDRPDGGLQSAVHNEGSQRWIKLDMAGLVCMTKEEAQRHERDVLKGNKKPEEMYDQPILARVKRKQAEEKTYEKYR